MLKGEKRGPSKMSVVQDFRCLVLFLNGLLRDTVHKSCQLRTSGLERCLAESEHSLPSCGQYERACRDWIGEDAAMASWLAFSRYPGRVKPAWWVYKTVEYDGASGGCDFDPEQSLRTWASHCVLAFLDSRPVLSSAGTCKMHSRARAKRESAVAQAFDRLGLRDLRATVVDYL